MLCKRTIKLDTLGVKALVSQREKNTSWLLKVSSEVTLSHTFVHLYHQLQVQGHPLPLDQNSVPPLPSHSQATLKFS